MVCSATIPACSSFRGCKTPVPNITLVLTSLGGTLGQGSCREHGCRFRVALGAQTIVLILGLTIGGIAALGGRAMDNLMMRITDIGYAFPDLLFIILLRSALEGHGLPVLSNPIVQLIVAISFVGWVTVARLVRGQMLSLKERDYVLAARALGARQCACRLRAHAAQYPRSGDRCARVWYPARDLLRRLLSATSDSACPRRWPVWDASLPTATGTSRRSTGWWLIPASVIAMSDALLHLPRRRPARRARPALPLALRRDIQRDRIQVRFREPVVRPEDGDHGISAATQLEIDAVHESAVGSLRPGDATRDATELDSFPPARLYDKPASGRHLEVGPAVCTLVLDLRRRVAWRSRLATCNAPFTECESFRESARQDQLVEEGNVIGRGKAVGRCGSTQISSGPTIVQ